MVAEEDEPVPCRYVIDPVVFRMGRRLPRRVDPEEQVRDILAARIWLSARADVASVAVMGLSHGGGASIKATAIDPEIVALATVGAPGNGERWHRSKRTTEEWVVLQRDLATDRIARALTGSGRTLPYQEMSPPGPAERAPARRQAS